MADLENSRRRWLGRLARFGYGVHGCIYLIVGGLAMLAVIGKGGKTTGSLGVLRDVLAAPAGKVLLGAVALGLLGYALWRFFQGVLNADQLPPGTEAKFIRSGAVISCLGHIMLTLVALNLIFEWGIRFSSNARGGDKVGDWTATLLAQPFGRWLVGGVGVFILVLGIAQFLIGLKAKFEQHLNVTQTHLRWITPMSRFALAARTVVFAILGGFFLAAAIQYDPDEAQGLGGALQTLRDQPYGPWLLGIVATGLLAFAAFDFVRATYRRIRPAEQTDSAQ